MEGSKLKQLKEDIRVILKNNCYSDKEKLNIIYNLLDSY